MSDIIARALAVKSNLSRLTPNDGKTYQIVAGVLRNNGSGWDFLDNVGHEPINISTVTNTTTQIHVNYAFTAKKVISFVATPDETYAIQGLFCGASVGYETAWIQVSYGDGVVDPNTLTESVGNIWVMGIFEV